MFIDKPKQQKQKLITGGLVFQVFRGQFWIYDVKGIEIEHD